MPLSGFDPLVARWFSDTLGTPTAAQQRGWQAIRRGQHTLIAAPTGSGKTLAAFLTAIDELVQEAAHAPLPDEVRVVYVSPLKALSADIHKNLGEPCGGIAALAEAAGVAAPRITAAVRTGDTTSSARAAMLRTPPHILVTTPESLYLLLTSSRGRQMLRTTRTVIVDEIHAVIGTRRGAHLALTLERLQHAAERPLLRLGLSATQKPVEEVARYLVGADPTRGECTIVDEGHRRALDLEVEIPRSPLDTVMAHEVWEEYYDTLTRLIGEHKTTLVFVNTRRLAERLARHLSERLGDDAVTAHHGSLSKERRLDAEHRLKTGALKALVATASLELGIDIGHVDLVCQIGSPHRIATLLQRVGRSGHTVSGMPKGRLLPVSRDDLFECAALLRSVRRGELDRIAAQDAPLDVLAQQITAEVASADYEDDALFDLVRRAWPYRDLPRDRFDAVVHMLGEGFTTRRTRRSALVHRDEVHRMLRARRGSRLLALTSGGAIPEVADYRVVLEPDETFIGTLNEDFAIESTGGDVFQLGNASWRVTQVTAGTVRVTDAQGAPPNLPFWLGEAPARSDELSRSVSELRMDLDAQLGRCAGAMVRGCGGADEKRCEGAEVRGCGGAEIRAWLESETGLCAGGAEQVAEYLTEGRRALEATPTQTTLILERFFDESGGMQLVLHAPFGSRINKAWALALRKRFCRQFNFELQAAATDDAMLLSLGPQHSFPLADVFRYLHPASVREVLVQALLDAPLFQTRWRWNATVSLAVPRHRGGRKVPPQLQRMQADDLMAAVFPDAAACLENLPGDREIPDHPLVRQTLHDCLHEAMDLDGLIEVLTRIHNGELTCIARDTPEPSAFAHDILNARPYAFLDDAPLEERRTMAVQTRRSSARGADEFGVLDPAAIDRVRDEARPDPRDAEELHDALVTCGFLNDLELSGLDDQVASLIVNARATRVVPVPGSAVLVAAERLPELLAIHPEASLVPPISAPPGRAGVSWTRESALVEILRSRLGILGPITAAALAEMLSVSEADATDALMALESDGAVLRGRFSRGVTVLEWCDRRLLARIHRYTLSALRQEISPVSAADFMRFLFAWQHVDAATRLAGPDGTRAIIAQLDGLELPARAWERHVLPSRLEHYDASHLDMLCLTGDAAWARLSCGPTQVVGATPIAIFLREHADMWLSLADRPAPATVLEAPVAMPLEDQDREDNDGTPGSESIEWTGTLPIAVVTDASATARVFDHLCRRGASFAHELAAACALDSEGVRDALARLAAAGLVSSDGFAGLRALITSGAPHGSPRHHRMETAGRWFALDAGAHQPAADNANGPGTSGGAAAATEDATVAFAWSLLRRYGVVFRRLLGRENTAVPWRALAKVYRRLEARGEIRGGRFVSGMSGEQFALPDAVERLREIRRSATDNRLITISAADPLNLTGIITPGDRIRVTTGNRIVYRNGIPVAAMEGDMLRTLSSVEPDVAMAAAAAAAGRGVPVLSGYVGRAR